MAGGARLGRDFGWYWAAYGASAFGTGLAFNALPLLALTALHADAAEVAALAATGSAAGAAAAVPLGRWVDRHRKRPVMVAMDLVRCAGLLSVPLAYAFGLLGLPQLLLVSALVAAADITFGAAAGACLKALVPREDLLVATARLESTTWTATVLGPPAGGALAGLLGPVVTVLADAMSYAFSAAGIRAITTNEPPPPGREPRPAGTRGKGRPRTARDTRGAAGERGVGAVTSGRAVEARGGAVEPGRPAALGRAAGEPGGVLDGWRFILAHPELRPLFLHVVLVNALIMASVPPLAVLMLGPLGFAPWQYGLAFAVPCLGGLVGARLTPPLVARFGEDRVLFGAGALRVCWPVGLAFVGPGTAGLVLVMGVELALITCIGVFNPVFAARRLARTPTDRVARVLSGWSVTAKGCTAAVTALWGVLAAVAGPRPAIALAGVLLLATPLLLPRPDRVPPAPPRTLPDPHPTD